MTRLPIIAAALLLTLPAFAGCSASPVKPESQSFVHLFQGTPAESRVDFDLVGEWDIFRYTKTAHLTNPTERFDKHFTLKRDKELGKLAWRDVDRPEYFRLSEGRPQFLHWGGQHGETWFSINRHSFGLMELTDDDGRLYMAIRTDGGQDLPPLEYPK